MSKAAPGWLRFTARTSQGILTSGKLVKEGNNWTLQWEGATPLQLKFSETAKPLKTGDQVTLLGTIVDAQPPAIIKVNFVMPR